MRPSFLLLIPLISVAALCRADETSFYFLHNLAVQYEGTGYRQTPSGWELKVKPQGQGQGLRWRRGALQAQYWRNNPYFSWEDGNAADAVMRQTGQTRMALNALVVDGRFPLMGSRVEAVAGALGLHAVMDRRDVVFNTVLDAGETRESISALGPVLGFHTGGRKELRGRWALWADGEILAGQFLWTRNRQKADGGSISRDGFSYLFRAEAGLAAGRWRLGAGLVRHMHEVLVPGGKSRPNGGAASLPINKFDFASPFLSLSYDL